MRPDKKLVLWNVFLVRLEYIITPHCMVVKVVWNFKL